MKGVLIMAVLKQTIHIAVNQNMMSYLKKRADEHGLTMCGFIKFIIAQYMANDKQWQELNR